MLDQKERQVIDELFGKLQQLDRQAPQRDAEAEEHIRKQVATLPASPYYMAQAILVQEQALGTLQSRVQELEQAAAGAGPAGGGFLGGLFGAPQGRRPAPGRGRPAGSDPPAISAARPEGAPGSPWGRPAGGGFLAGAMQTALGVAGGMMIANAITSAFESGDRSRGGAGRAEQDDTTVDDPQMDQGPAGETTRRSTISAATPAASAILARQRSEPGRGRQTACRSSLIVRAARYPAREGTRATSTKPESC